MFKRMMILGAVASALALAGCEQRTQDSGVEGQQQPATGGSGAGENPGGTGGAGGVDDQSGTGGTGSVDGMDGTDDPALNPENQRPDDAADDLNRGAEPEPR